MRAVICKTRAKVFLTAKQLDHSMQCLAPVALHTAFFFAKENSSERAKTAHLRCWHPKRNGCDQRCGCQAARLSSASQVAETQQLWPGWGRTGSASLAIVPAVAQLTPLFLPLHCTWKLHDANNGICDLFDAFTHAWISLTNLC